MAKKTGGTKAGNLLRSIFKKKKETVTVTKTAPTTGSVKVTDFSSGESVTTRTTTTPSGKTSTTRTASGSSGGSVSQAREQQLIQATQNLEAQRRQEEIKKQAEIQQQAEIKRQQQIKLQQEILKQENQRKAEQEQLRKIKIATQKNNLFGIKVPEASDFAKRFKREEEQRQRIRQEAINFQKKMSISEKQKVVSKSNILKKVFPDIFSTKNKALLKEQEILNSKIESFNKKYSGELTEAEYNRAIAESRQLDRDQQALDKKAESLKSSLNKKSQALKIEREKLRSTLGDLQRARVKDAVKIENWRKGELNKIKNLSESNKKKELRRINRETIKRKNDLKAKHDGKIIKTQNQLNIKSLASTGINTLIFGKEVVKVGAKVGRGAFKLGERIGSSKETRKEAFKDIGKVGKGIIKGSFVTGKTAFQVGKAIGGDKAQRQRIGKFLKTNKQNLTTLVKAKAKEGIEFVKVSPIEAVVVIGGEILILKGTSKLLKGSKKIDLATKRKLVELNEGILKRVSNKLIVKKIERNIIPRTISNTRNIRAIERDILKLIPKSIPKSNLAQIRKLTRSTINQFLKNKRVSLELSRKFPAKIRFTLKEIRSIKSYPKLRTAIKRDVFSKFDVKAIRKAKAKVKVGKRVVSGVKLKRKEFKSFQEASKELQKIKRIGKFVNKINVKGGVGKIETLPSKALTKAELDLFKIGRKIPQQLLKNVNSASVNTFVQKFSAEVPVITRFGNLKKGFWRVVFKEKTFYQNSVSFSLFNKAKKPLGTITFNTLSSKPITRFRSLSSALKWGTNKEIILSKLTGKSFVRSFVLKARGKKITAKEFLSKVRITNKGDLQEIEIFTKKIPTKKGIEIKVKTKLKKKDFVLPKMRKLEFKELKFKGKNLGQIKINNLRDMKTIREFIYKKANKKYPTANYVFKGLKGQPSANIFIEPQVFKALKILERKGFNTVSSGFTPLKMQQHILFSGENLIKNKNFVSTVIKNKLKLRKVAGNIEVYLNQKGKSLKDVERIFNKFSVELKRIGKPIKRTITTKRTIRTFPKKIKKQFKRAIPVSATKGTIRKIKQPLRSRFNKKKNVFEIIQRGKTIQKIQTKGIINPVIIDTSLIDNAVRTMDKINRKLLSKARAKRLIQNKKLILSIKKSRPFVLKGEKKVIISNAKLKQIKKISTETRSIKESMAGRSISPKVRITRRVEGIKKLKQLQRTEKAIRSLAKKRALDVGSRTAVASALSLVSKFKKDLKSGQVILTDQATKSLQKSIQKSLQKSTNKNTLKTIKAIQVIFPRLILVPRTPLRPTPRSPRKKPRVIIRRKRKEPTNQFRTLAKPVKIFNVVVKKRGRNIILKDKLTNGDALNFMALELDTQLLRSAVLRPIGTSRKVRKLPIKYNKAFQNRKQKLRQFKIKQKKKIPIRGYIEKRKFSLDTRGEKTQLSRAIKKKAVKKKPVKKRVVKRKPTKKRVVKKRK